MGSCLPVMCPVAVSTLKVSRDIILQGFAGTPLGGLPESFTSTGAGKALLDSSELWTPTHLPQQALQVRLVGGLSPSPFLPGYSVSALKKTAALYFCYSCAFKFIRISSLFFVVNSLLIDYSFLSQKDSLR